MSDDKSDSGPQDRSRVSMSEDYEAAYWTEKWGVSREQLAAAVAVAGNAADAVAAALGKSA